MSKSPSLTELVRGLRRSRPGGATRAPRTMNVLATEEGREVRRMFLAERDRRAAEYRERLAAAAAARPEPVKRERKVQSRGARVRGRLPKLRPTRSSLKEEN